MLQNSVIKYVFYLVVFGTTAFSQATPVEDFWFAGAEINRYELTQNHYGQQYPGHAEFIFVTEPFLLKKQVKHEFGDATSTNVLKLNALRTFNTGIYSYRTMTSTFRPINQYKYPRTLKSTTSIQDWCGQTFQQINQSDSSWKIELRSYFQNEADTNLEILDGLLEDGIWLQIRLDPAALPVGPVSMIPGSVSTRFTHRPIRKENAVGVVKKKKQITSYTLTYPSLNRRLNIVFDSKFPHIIREWSETDKGGTTNAQLKDRIMNSEYWSKNKPKDAILRKRLGLSPIAN